MTGQAPLEVIIQGQVVGFAPVHQMFHLLSVGRVVISTAKGPLLSCFLLTSQCCYGPGTTVVGHQGEWQRNQDTDLRGACAQGGDIGGVVVWK